MTHQDKLKEMYRHMSILGVSKSTAAPPAWRLLWRLGIEVPPPLFIPFFPGALAMGSYFAVFWGLIMWAFFWFRQGMSFVAMAAATLVAGALFGLFMAAYFRHVSRKHKLPAWSEYTGAP